MPGRSARPARPPTWCSSWIGALGRAQIAAAEAEIGIDHADQGQQREMMPLGDDLRADQHVDGDARSSRSASSAAARGPVSVSLTISASARRRESAPPPLR